MKIKKFNENIDFDNIENELIEKYNIETKQYNVRVRIDYNNSNNDLYTGGAHDNLDDAVEEYKKFVENQESDIIISKGKPSYYFITEETKIMRIVPTEEVKLHINANKYNL